MFEEQAPKPQDGETYDIQGAALVILVGAWLIAYIVVAVRAWLL
jgi:hypothetical protein